MDKEQALSLIKKPIIVAGNQGNLFKYKIDITIDGIIYSTQYFDLGFITQQHEVLVKILEAIKHEWRLNTKKWECILF